MADVDDETLTAIREILEDHRGKDDPITSREISNQVGIDEPGSFPTTRGAITKLLHEEKIPIGASGNGYFILESEDEIDEYIGNLTRRINGLEERKIAVWEAVKDSPEFTFDDDSDLV